MAKRCDTAILGTHCLEVECPDRDIHLVCFDVKDAFSVETPSGLHARDCGLPATPDQSGSASLFGLKKVNHAGVRD